MDEKKTFDGSEGMKGTLSAQESGSPLSFSSSSDITQDTDVGSKQKKPGVMQPVLDHSDGKPPLVPRRPGHYRSRTKSGDYTAMSALTEETEEGSSPENAKAQPKSPVPQTQTHRRLLTLDDVVAPVQLEAETAIFKAIEQRQRLASTDTADILFPVFDSSSHETTLSPPPEPVRSSRDAQAPTPSSPKSADDRIHDLFILHKAHQRFKKRSMGEFPIEATEAEDSPSRIPSSDTEKLYKHVQVLFDAPIKHPHSPPRHSGEAGKLNGTDSAESTVSHNTKTSSNSKWGTLRAAVKKGPQAYAAGNEVAATTNNTNVGDEEEGGGQKMNPNPEDSTKNESADKPASKKKKKGRSWFHTQARQIEVQAKDTFREALLPQLPKMTRFTKTVLLKFMCPLLGIGVLVYYFTSNPLVGKTGASLSWWLIFCGRLLVTLSMAKFAEFLVLDILALRTKLIVKLIGSYLALTLVQARGWPFTLLMWTIFNFALLYGNGAFAQHWLHKQDVMDVFGPKNTSGGVLINDWYRNIVVSCLFISIMASIKRTLVAIMLGRRSLVNYGQRMESILRKIILMDEVAHWAQDLDDYFSNREHQRATSLDTVDVAPFSGLTSDFAQLVRSETTPSATGTSTNGDDADNSEPGSPAPDATLADSPVKKSNSDRIPKPSIWAFSLSRTRGGSGRSNHQVMTDIADLLGPWEEPKMLSHTAYENASVTDILQFRQALRFMRTIYPFSVAFGRADTRQHCIISAQKVYWKLHKYTPGNEHLPFSTIAALAKGEDGKVNKDKLRSLRRLFQPNSDGCLTPLDFVRSCDNLYKKLQLFRAATANSSQINRVFEQILNVAFYFIMALIVLALLDFDPWAVFASVSSIVLAFSFAFGGAMSKAFEGVLLITVRKPYDIGDRIQVSIANADFSTDGSKTWFVEGVDLFTTTLRFAATNEVTTIANGSLANMSIINWGRSFDAIVYLYIKFTDKVPLERIAIFRTSVETFVAERPREWVQITAFRPGRIVQEQGFIEYTIGLQHTHGWQNFGPILQSKADLYSFCFEVSKQLGMRYIAPPLPIQLGIEPNDNGNNAPVNPEGDTGNTPKPATLQSLADLAQQIKSEDKKTK